MLRMVGCWTFVAAGFFPFCVGLRAAEVADLAVINAQIYTVDPLQQSATAIAVKGNKILAVGDDVSQFIGPGTQKIDARGKTIVPGFIDSHGHVLSLGQSLAAIDLRGVGSENEAAQLVAAAVRSKRPGEWIIGNAWDQNLWPSKSFPIKQSLDRVAPTNPVVLSRVDGHAVWANSAALKIAGITSNSRDPQGGRILRDASGEPTGVLVDQAQSLINSKISPPPPTGIENALEQAAQLCSSFGLTTVHDAGIDASTLAAYRALIAEGRLPLRIYAMIRVADAGSLWRFYQSRGPEIGDFLTVRSLKLYADGALGSRGAALLEPYSDDPGNRGLLISSRELIEKVAREAIAAGFQVNTHAIGDRGNRTVLEAYAAALGNQKNDKRFRVEHAQVVAPEDFGRFRDNSIIASMQPTHATSDMPWAALRIGPERIRGAYAWQTFRKLGVRLAFGSDFPVESPNPIWGFYAAITRQDHDGNPPGGWFPEQRLTRAEALRAFTIDGAYAAFEEDRKGSLVPGKLADFVMLSDDIMRIPDSQVWRARVLMTVLDGKIVYRRPGE
jgi:predicted amidohydrolase YtcJ